jgi:hypothetical protein
VALREATDAIQIDAFPADARPRAFIELTTHKGHFMGRGISRLLVYRHRSEAFVRDVGSWDPLPKHLAAGYAAGGRAAQQRFWGPEDAEASLLVQLALVTG